MWEGLNDQAILLEYNTLKGTFSEYRMVNKKEVKECILSVVKKVVSEHSKQIKSQSGDVGEKMCLHLVSEVSSQLNNEVGTKCPSTEGYKYVVHVTLQERR